MDPITAAQQAAQALTSTIAGLDSDQLSQQSPCAEFDVRGVVDHAIGGTNMFAGMLGGTPGDGPADGADAAALAATYKASTDQLVAAASAEGALEQTVKMGPMELPGAAALSLITADAIVHAWDISKAAGCDHGMSEELAQFALGSWKQMLAPPMRDGKMFGPEQECPAGASTMDQLAAFTGRSV